MEQGAVWIVKRETSIALTPRSTVDDAIDAFSCAWPVQPPLLVKMAIDSMGYDAVRSTAWLAGTTSFSSKRLDWFYARMCTSFVERPLCLLVRVDRIPFLHGYIIYNVPSKATLIFQDPRCTRAKGRRVIWRCLGPDGFLLEGQGIPSTFPIQGQ